jgi:hypothetical protein
MIPGEGGRGAGMKGGGGQLPDNLALPRGAPGRARSPDILAPENNL